MPYVLESQSCLPLMLTVRTQNLNARSNSALGIRWLPGLPGLSLFQLWCVIFEGGNPSKHLMIQGDLFLPGPHCLGMICQGPHGRWVWSWNWVGAELEVGVIPHFTLFLVVTHMGSKVKWNGITGLRLPTPDLVHFSIGAQGTFHHVSQAHRNNFSSEPHRCGL